jgi:hypothetical protein
MRTALAAERTDKRQISRVLNERAIYPGEVHQARFLGREASQSSAHLTCWLRWRRQEIDSSHTNFKQQKNWANFDEKFDLITQSPRGEQNCETFSEAKKNTAGLIKFYISHKYTH